MGRKTGVAKRWPELSEERWRSRKGRVSGERLQSGSAGGGGTEDQPVTKKGFSDSRMANLSFPSDFSSHLEKYKYLIDPRRVLFNFKRWEGPKVGKV